MAEVRHLISTMAQRNVELVEKFLSYEHIRKFPQSNKE